MISHTIRPRRIRHRKSFPVMSHTPDLPSSHQTSWDPWDALAGDAVMLKDWADFYDALPADLVFECSVEFEHTSCGVAVYRDRVVVDEPGAGLPTAMNVEDITSWNVAQDGEDTVVEVAAQRTRRTRLPLAYAGAIRVALAEVLGEPVLN
jgi:hypothetical protein